MKYHENSKEIVLLRDGRDIAVSFAHHFIRRGQGFKFDTNNMIENSFIKEVAFSYNEYYVHLAKFRKNPQV